MGDLRYRHSFARVQAAEDPAEAIRQLPDESVIEALAWAATEEKRPRFANVLATEAINRLARLRTTVEYLAEGVVTVGLDGRITLVNAETERQTGWRRRELIGQDFCDILANHGGRATGHTCALRRVLEKGGSAYVDEGETLQRKDGSEFPVSFAAAAVLQEGDVRGAVVVFRDVTERTAAWNALRTREERMRRMARAAPDPIIIHADGEVLDVNDAALALFALRSEDQAVGRTLLDFVATEDRDAVRAALGEGGRTSLEVRCVRGDGSRVRVRALGRSFDFDGEPVRVVVLYNFDPDGDSPA